MHCLIIKGLHFALTILLLLSLFFIGIPSENLGIRESISANIWLVWLDYSGTPRGEYGHQLKGTCHGVRVIRVFVSSGPSRAKRKRLGQMFCRCKD